MKKIKCWENIWKFVKRFPSVSYGAVGIMIFAVNFYCIKCISSIAIILTPFIPIILICAGFANKFGWFIGLFLFASILLCLDIFIILLIKIFNKYFAQKLLIRIFMGILIIIIWLYVLLLLIDNLPIDM